jgi:chromosome segregation ATPase
LAQELRKYQDLSNVTAVQLKKLEMAKTVLLATQKELMQREEVNEQRIGVLQQQQLQHEHEHKSVKSTLHRLEEEVQGMTKTISEHEKKEIRLQHRVNRLTQQTAEKDKQLGDQENAFNKVNGQRVALAKEKDSVVARQAVVEEKYHTSTRDCTQLQQELHAMKVTHTELVGTLREAEKELEAKREQELSTARRLTTITTELSNATKTNKLNSITTSIFSFGIKQKIIYFLFIRN